MKTVSVHYPLIISYRDSIRGNGFLADVQVNGRALMLKEEDEKWWMYGVFPGSVAECGDTPNEAFLAFRNRYREILFDIAAEEVGGYEQFKTEVERFFYEKDEEEEQRWNAAHKLIREGSVTPEEAFSNLERMAPSLKPPMILLSRLDETQRFDASQNHTDCAAVAA